jgi:phosphoserine phosphatase
MPAFITSQTDTKMLTILHTHTLDTTDKEILTRAIPGEWESCGGYFRLHHSNPVSTETLHALRSALPFDVNPLPEDFSGDEVRLVISDMDSTLINIECVDEIADFAGVKPQVAAITEAAMRGEIDFSTSLTQRVATLEGLDESVLRQVYDERLRTNPGAETMLAGLKAQGVRFALVSGGFTFFTERLKERLGLDYARANVLGMEGGTLTGHVIGGIIDATAKEVFLMELCEELGISPNQAIAMGDGANDLKMLNAAGLGVAYRAKPRVQEQCDVVFNHSGLDGVLHFLA